MGASEPIFAEIPCEERLRIPKVAMLFLARGGMPMSAVWQAWLQPVAGLIPIQARAHRVPAASCVSHMHAVTCSTSSSSVPDCVLLSLVSADRAAQGLCAQATEKQFCLPGVPNGPPSAVLQCAAPAGSARQAQLLYSFYVHSSRIRFKGFPPGDLFHGTLITNLTHAGARTARSRQASSAWKRNLVQPKATWLPRQHQAPTSRMGTAGWGDTTHAVRELLRAALLEPRNQRFVLLSDADIPLYPATMTYLQLFQVRLVMEVSQRGWPACLQVPTCRLEGLVAGAVW